MISKRFKIKLQLDLWDLLLETRVKLQNIVSIVNQYPQYDSFNEIVQKSNQTEDSSVKETMKESKLIKNRKKYILKIKFKVSSNER
jgi:hypothetical protein